MTLQDLVSELALEELTADGAGSTATATADVTRGYASDLLSDVLANAPAGGILVTLQVHLNVIAVASHAGLAAVIFSCGRRPEDDVVERAAEEGLALFGSKSDTFELAGRLYELGLRGNVAGGAR
jgi:hypothetical protein